MLVVLERIAATKPLPAQARCRCDCGGERVAQEHHLYIGRIRSCVACGYRHLPRSQQQRRVAEQIPAWNKAAYRRLTHIHRGMVERCYAPSHRGFNDYGGRGIKVCDSWRYQPSAFIAWAMQQPNHADVRYSIDRIDNNGNYEPTNCRFATPETQHNNKRNNIVVEFRGEHMTATQFGRTHCPRFSAPRVIWWLKANDLNTEGLLAHYQRCASGVIV